MEANVLVLYMFLVAGSIDLKRPISARIGVFCSKRV